MSLAKEATARIKINKLLETAGWRFFKDDDAPANIRLEPGVTIKSGDLDTLGDNFEKTTKGFVDFLLLDARGFPPLVLEAKDPGHARPYLGRGSACHPGILSNGSCCRTCRLTCRFPSRRRKIIRVNRGHLPSPVRCVMIASQLQRIRSQP